jgi:phage-related protein
MGLFSRIGKAVSNVAKGVGNAVKSVAKGVGNAVKSVAEGVGNAVKSVVNTVTSFFSDGKTAEQVLDSFINASGRVDTGN